MALDYGKVLADLRWRAHRIIRMERQIVQAWEAGLLSVLTCPRCGGSLGQEDGSCESCKDAGRFEYPLARSQRSYFDDHDPDVTSAEFRPKLGEMVPDAAGEPTVDPPEPEKDPDPAPHRRTGRRVVLTEDVIRKALSESLSVNDAIQKAGCSTQGFYSAMKRYGIDGIALLNGASPRSAAPEHPEPEAPPDPPATAPKVRVKRVLSGVPIQEIVPQAESFLVRCVLDAGEPVRPDRFIEWCRKGEWYPKASDDELRIAFANAVHDYPETFHRRGSDVSLTLAAQKAHEAKKNGGS